MSLMLTVSPKKPTVRYRPPCDTKAVWKFGRALAVPKTWPASLKPPTFM